MVYQSILYEKEDGVAIITLNRPDKLNALDAGILQEMARALEDVGKDDETKALIITGAGRGFCSGIDLTAEISGVDPKQPGINRTVRIEPSVSLGWAVHQLRNLIKPTIAAVNGVTAGAGFSIASICDIRIASEDARFSAVFVRRGLVPDNGLTYFLPRIVGTAKALELMWTGDMIDVVEAERIGLVTKVVPQSDLLPVAKELAMRFAKGPSVAIELTKRMVYNGLETDDFASQLGYETLAQNICAQTEDVEEGRRSFLEKRDPIFRGM
jgi:2-(1,2-epoxy-1,2-dihydrophenyl)acetyl-CoA isomerase